MRSGPTTRARFGIGRILLADMDAVAAQFGGEVGPVIEDEGGARRLHDGAQQIGGAADFVIADMFQAQLKRRDIAALQRALQDFGEIQRRQARRRNQIEATTDIMLLRPAPALRQRGRGRCVHSG